MADVYLNIYGSLLAFGLLVIASVMLARRGYSEPAALVGVPSLVLMLFKAMAEITGPGPFEYVHGRDGEILGAAGAISVWQQAVFWIYPVAMIAIAAGLLWLALSLPKCQRPNNSDAQTSEQRCAGG